MNNRQRLQFQPARFLDKLSTAILVIGWGLVIMGAIFVAVQLYPIVKEWIDLFNDGYGVIHGEWVSPKNYEFLSPFIQ